VKQPDDVQELIRRLLDLADELERQRATVAKAIEVAKTLAATAVTAAPGSADPASRAKARATGVANKQRN
jgi:hypothetical protein